MSPPAYFEQWRFDEFWKEIVRLLHQLFPSFEDQVFGTIWCLLFYKILFFAIPNYKILFFAIPNFGIFIVALVYHYSLSLFFIEDRWGFRDEEFRYCILLRPYWFSMVGFDANFCESWQGLPFHRLFIQFFVFVHLIEFQLSYFVGFLCGRFLAEHALFRVPCLSRNPCE